MTYSVLHLKSLYNDAACGVWCSESQSWVFKGSYSACFSWKNEQENIEQAESNRLYLKERDAERQKLFALEAYNPD